MLAPPGSQHFTEYSSSVKKRISTGYVGTFGQPIFTKSSVKYRICIYMLVPPGSQHFTEYLVKYRICIYMLVPLGMQPTFYRVLGTNGTSWQPTLPIQYRNSREFVGTYGKPTFYRVVGKIQNTPPQNILLPSASFSGAALSFARSLTTSTKGRATK